jgi:restriction system protein
MTIPTVNELMLPTLRALRELGGSGGNAEIRSAVADVLGISEQDQQIPQGRSNPNVSRLEYRLKWARTNLKTADVIRSIGSGLWEITELGLKTSDADVVELVKQSKKRPALEISEVATAETEDEAADAAVADTPEDSDWESLVITAVQEMDPTQVERLFLRILREEGFEQLEHVGKPGDGGIDGTGVYRISLLSFKIYFQCKRYQAGIGSGDIRNFRGAMEGRGERGLFVTTSWFTRSAEEEASRAGARPVDLIDGTMLARLIAKHNLGVSVKQQDVHVVDESFFRAFSF